MGYKAKLFAPVKVDLDDQYWAKLKPLTKAEDDECQLALLGGELEAIVGAQQVMTRLHSREHSDQQLLKAIVAWNLLEDDDATVMPITLENIQGLTDAHATKLLAVVRGITSPLAQGPARQDLPLPLPSSGRVRATA